MLSVESELIADGGSQRLNALPGLFSRRSDECRRQQKAVLAGVAQLNRVGIGNAGDAVSVVVAAPRRRIQHSCRGAHSILRSVGTPNCVRRYLGLFEKSGC